MATCEVLSNNMLDAHNYYIIHVDNTTFKTVADLSVFVSNLFILNYAYYYLLLCVIIIL